MQRANLLVHLGGDTGNKVPLHAVTPAEVAVLQQVHGADSVSEIDIYDAKALKGLPMPNSRVERERLASLYPGRDGEGNRHIDVVYPVGARLPTHFRELGLDDSYYKAERRRTPDEVDAETPVLAVSPEEAFAAEKSTGRRAEDHDDYVEAAETGDYEVADEQGDAEDAADILPPKELRENQRAAAEQAVASQRATAASVPEAPLKEQGAPSKRAPRIGGAKNATKAEKEAAGTPAASKSVLD